MPKLTAMMLWIRLTFRLTYPTFDVLPMNLEVQRREWNVELALREPARRMMTHLNGAKKVEADVGYASTSDWPPFFSRFHWRTTATSSSNWQSESSVFLWMTRPHSTITIIIHVFDDSCHLHYS